MPKPNDYEYTIHENMPIIKNKPELAAEPLEIRAGDTYEICYQDVKKCVAELRKLGDYPSVKQVRKVIDKYQFIDPLDIKDNLLEVGLNNTDTPCAFGIRLGALVCVAYNYIGAELEDEEQMPAIWEAVERANGAFEYEFSGKLSEFDIDRIVSMGARQDEAFVLARLLGVDHERAKAIIAEDEAGGIDVNKLRKDVYDYSKSQNQILFDDLKNELKFEMEKKLNEIRAELGLDPVEEDEEEFEDEPLPLFKTKKSKPNLDHERQQ